MSFSSIVWQERAAIVQFSHIAIVHGMLDTWKRCISRLVQPSEPDFIAGLVLESTPLLYNALSNIFLRHGISFSIAAVFCHQTPKLKYSGMRKSSCELGDMLVVHVHRKRSGDLQRNALLYQAKMSSKQPHRIQASGKDQLKLYTDWPDFQYHNSPPLTGERRSVSPKVPHTGAQYLLIDDRPPNNPQSGLLGFPNTYPIGSSMPDEFLRDHNHLAAELLNFLLFRSGRAFEDRQSASQKKDWSQVVWDLVKVGLQKAFSRKISGRDSDPRYTGGPINIADGCSFSNATSVSSCTTAADILGHRNTSTLFSMDSEIPPSETFNHEDTEMPKRGVSLILMETFERSAE